MSDNIDYAELDKAVNEAMQSQPKRSSSRSTTKTTSAAAHPVTARPTITRPAAKPIARPQNRGRFMDFAPRSASTRPTTATHSPAKPVAMRPTTANIPQRSVAKPASRIATVRKTAAAPRAETPAASRPSVAAKIQQKQQRVTTATAPKETPKPVAHTPKIEAPDANSYSLGGRSPFLVDTKVEKRPLGTNIPETNAATVHSTKNIYSQKNPSKAPVAKRKKHTVTEAPKSHSGWLWTLIVILVIASGAGLGYLAYLIVFAN